ncbi:MAG: META domain-containing protein [Flavobacterium sp.]|nr:MAG: META domain-containing protein [Flavobacterium sp.]
MKKMITTFAAAITLLITASCGSTQGTLSTAMLTAQTWELESVNGKTVSAADYSRGLPTITFGTDNKVSGNGGCNGFSGSYNLNDEGGVNFSQFMSTKMACEGTGETEFMNALDRARKAKIDKEKLTFLRGTKDILVFTAKK